MFASTHLLEAVRSIELDGRQRGVDVDARRAGGNRRGFGSPEQRRSDPLPRRAASYVDRRTMPRIPG
jgi:hypothetical protein